MADRPASASGRAASAASGKGSAPASTGAKGRASASRTPAVPDPTTAPAAAAPSVAAPAVANGPAPSAGEPAAPRRTLSRPFSAGFAVTLGGLLALALGLTVLKLSSIVIYIAFALFVALGLDPVVSFLERRRLSRGWAIVIVCAAFTVVFVGLVLIIVPTLVTQVAQFVTDLPGLVNSFEQSDLYAWLTTQLGVDFTQVVNQVETYVSDPANLAAIFGGVLAVAATVGDAISGVVIVLVLSLYFIASLTTIKATFVRLVPARNRPTVSGITDQVTASVGGYLQGMVLLAFCNAVFALILHLVLGLPFALLLSVVAFAITLIPLVGPLLYLVLASVLALFSSPLSALIFAIAYLVYIQVEAYVLTPRVMNRTVSVPGSLVVIGALVGGTLLGLLGALVAIPVTASVILIVKQVWIPRQDAKT